jgi:sugar-specific transcriptional regulator TrmB
MNDFVTEQLRILGLREREARVFTTLATFGRMKVSKITKRSGLSRTTVVDIVRRLSEQGMIKKMQVGKHDEYEVGLDEVADRLDSLERKLRIKPKKEEYVEEEHEKKACEGSVLFTKECATLEEAFRAHAGERVRALVHRVSGNAPEYAKESVARCLNYATHAQKTGVQLEMLVCLGVARALREHKNGVVLPKRANALRLNVVPVSYCDAPADLVFFRDQIFVSKEDGLWYCETRADIVASMHHLLTIANETGWSVTMEAWLEE